MAERKGKGIRGWWGVNVNNVNLIKESMKVINPIHEFFFIILVFIISNLPGSSWKSVGSMVGTRDVNEVKVEGQDGDYPPVDTSTGRDVRIRQHPFDIPHVDFYFNIPDSNEIEAVDF
jgi:hypothetical protein